jgi:predicted MFS family arabinose efflux permease
MTDASASEATAKKTGASLSGWSKASALVVFGLTLVSFFNYTDRNALSVLIEPIKKELLLTDTQIGLITGLAFALFYAVMGLPIARLADRGNKAKILVACFVLWSLMTALSGLATSFLGLFLLRLMVGVGEAGCLPTSFAIISERFSAQQRPLVISIFQAGGRLGVALGMAGAGIAGQLFGWRIALLGLGIIGIPVALLVAVTLRGVDGPAKPVSHVMQEKTSLATILKFPGFVPMLVAISLASFGNYGISQWLPAFYVRSFGATLGTAGVWIGLTSGIGGVTGTLLGGAIAGVLVRRNQNWDLWLPALANIVSIPFFVAALLSGSVASASAFYCLAILISTLGGGVALAAFQRFTDAAHRATANAVMLMISALTGVGLGPVAVGVASDLFKSQGGPESLRWALVATTSVFAGASLFFYLTARAARTEPVPR